MKRWSSLQREIYKLIDEDLDLQIHLSIYRMKSQYGSTELPRYWMTLCGEIIFDYPRQFISQGGNGKSVTDLRGNKTHYPYETDISDISELLREYIDTPKEEVFLKHFENDLWGLADILKAADRRFGRKRLEQLRQTTANTAAVKIIDHRLGT